VVFLGAKGRVVGCYLENNLIVGCISNPSESWEQMGKRNVRFQSTRRNTGFDGS